MKKYTWITSVLFLGLASLVSVAHAGSQLLVTAVSDYDPYTTLLSVTTDDQGLLTGLSFTADDPSNAKGTFTLAQLKQGVVFRKDQASGKDVINLKAANVDPRMGGTVDMNYLKNGIWGTRESYFIVVQKVGDKFVAYTDRDHGSREFHKMTLKKNSFLGKIVGIDEVEVE